MLVEEASKGEEVIITVRGVPKARLCPIAKSSVNDKEIRKEWGQRLRESRASYTVKDSGVATQDVMNEIRQDRT